MASIISAVREYLAACPLLGLSDAKKLHISWTDDTVCGIYAELSAPELSESEYDYLNRLRRESKSSVKSGRTYKNVKISKYEGFSLVGRDSQ